MIVLETARLVIRDHLLGDLEPLHRLLSDGEVMRFLEDLKVSDLQGTRENLQIAMAEAARSDRRKFFFAIIERASSEYVGEIGFTVLQEEERGTTVEMGYFILEKFWSRGLVTEAGCRVIRFAFEECGVAEILIGCHKENRGSERVMIKLGFMKQPEALGVSHPEEESALRVEYHMVRKQSEISGCASSL